jgi:peptidoglycan lytic transglycosylase
VRINDRGPFVGDRIIDLSARAARALGIEEDGVARVRLELVSTTRANL